jgi:hypothetical protein
MYEKEVFLLGRWKNYDDLEESLTLNELIETYAAKFEAENRIIEAHVKIAGGTIEKPKLESDTEPKEETMEDRLARRKAERQMETKQFGSGIGYGTIGG